MYSSFADVKNVNLDLATDFKGSGCILALGLRFVLGSVSLFALTTVIFAL